MSVESELANPTEKTSTLAFVAFASPFIALFVGGFGIYFVEMTRDSFRMRLPLVQFLEMAFGLLPEVAAMVFSLIVLSRTASGNGRDCGKGWAIAGAGLSFVMMLPIFLMIVAQHSWIDN